MSTAVLRSGLLAALLAAVMAGTAFGMPSGSIASGSIASGATPAALLRDAASGSWTSEFGTLEFRDDGTATFSVKQCGYRLIRPGFAESLLDCEARTVEGTLRLEPGGYSVAGADATVVYAAYVDGRGRLHLGETGVVARLGKGRVGRAELAPGETLVVAGRRCSYQLPANEPRGEGIDDVEVVVTVACAFERDSGRTVLTYEVPIAGVEAWRVDALVYLKRSRLLVSPELVDRVFVRS